MGSILNLVFENWDNTNIALPNGNDLFKNSLFLPDFIHNNELFEVKNVKLTDVHLFNNFYFVIRHKIPLFQYLSESYDLFISDSVKLLIRNKNLKIIFIQEHESEYRIQDTIDLLDKLCIQNNLNSSNFYIICNNAEMSLYELSTKINLNKIEFLSEMSYELLKQFNPTFITNKSGKFALLHNRTPKNHRIILLALLKIRSSRRGAAYGFNKTSFSLLL